MQKKRELFLHSYTQYLRWTNINYTAANIDEKQGEQYYWGFFLTVQNYLTVTDISKTVS